MLNKGFGDTCKSVALVIFLGSLLGLIFSETGAIQKLTNSLVDLCGTKGVLWAAGISCFILGIPVFPNTVSLLTIPLYTNLSKETNVSMMAFAGVMQISIVTSSLVPPTPGPVAGAAVLGLPLGEADPLGHPRLRLRPRPDCRRAVRLHAEKRSCPAQSEPPAGG